VNSSKLCVEGQKVESHGLHRVVAMLQGGMITKKINLTAKAGKEAELEALLKEMVVESKPEQGCVVYDLYQFKDSPADFFLIEIWETAETLDAHKETAHFAKFKQLAPELIEAKSSEELNSFL
jgi:quinol monooxygenase YgiN